MTYEIFLYCIIVLSSYMLLNLMIWGHYTNGKVTQEYVNPHTEYHLEPIKASIRVFFLSFADALFVRDKHIVLMGYFNIPETSVQIIAYKDVTRNKFFVGTGKAMHFHSYGKVIAKINTIYEHNPVVRFKAVRLVQLLEHYTPENFAGIGIYKGRLLKSEVLHSSSSIPTYNHVQTQTVFEWDHYPRMGTQVFDGDVPTLPQTDVSETPDSSS